MWDSGTCSRWVKRATQLTPVFHVARKPTSAFAQRRRTSPLLPRAFAAGYDANGTYHEISRLWQIRA